MIAVQLLPHFISVRSGRGSFDFSLVHWDTVLLFRPQSDRLRHWTQALYHVDCNVYAPTRGKIRRGSAAYPLGSVTVSTKRAFKLPLHHMAKLVPQRLL